MDRFLGLLRGHTTGGHRVPPGYPGSSLSPQDRCRRGFSLIEILIAIAVLSIGILGVYAAFLYGNLGVKHGEQTTLATNAARDLVELIRMRNLSFSGGNVPPDSSTGLNDADDSVRRDLAAAPFGGDFPANSNLQRSIQMGRSSTDSDDYDYNLMRVTVRVFWNEEGKERSVEIQALHQRP